MYAVFVKFKTSFSYYHSIIGFLLFILSLFSEDLLIYNIHPSNKLLLYIHRFNKAGFYKSQYNKFCQNELGNYLISKNSSHLEFM